MPATPDLARMLAARTEALATMESLDGKSLRDMPPAEKLRAYVASEMFRDTDKAIVAALRREAGPVRAGGVVLHLTRDRLNFVSMDPATGRPIFMSPSARGWAASLYRYPGAGKVVAQTNRPEAMP